MLFRAKNEMVSEADALTGRTDQTMPVPETHFVNGRPLQGPWPDGFETVVFDPKRISYEQLLKAFWESHDPTQGMRQGNDVGTQYRSAIFVASDEQRRTAEAVKQRVDRSGKWKRPVVTEVVAAGQFYPAEGYHQDYLEKHPGGYTCHFMRD